MASRLPSRGEDGHALVLTVRDGHTMLICQCGVGQTFPPSSRRAVLDAHLRHRDAAGLPRYKTRRFGQPPVAPPPGLF